MARRTSTMTNNKLVAAAALLVAVVLALAATPAASQPVYDTFAQALDAQAPKGYSYAKRLVDALGLRPQYSNPNLKATILVPSDKAFEALAASSGVTPERLLSMVQTNALLKKMLNNAMSYNTIPDQVIGAFQFQDGGKYTTGHQGKQLTAKRSSEGVFLSGDLNNKGVPAKIVDANVRTKSGVAHGVNAVLLPFNPPRLGGAKAEGQ
jgi:uncharacterized surface protein with fasciclin (FAS1) repeats